MKRISGLLVGAALCAGCRSAQPVSDPFLGPTVVPPPATATPPPGQPYYGSPAGTYPPSTTAPPMTSPPIGGPAPASGIPTMPRNFSPAPAGGMSSFTPNVSPQQTASALPPGAAPAAYPISSAVRPTYGPPGGAAYPYPNNPQMAMAPQYGTPTLAPPPGTSTASNPLNAMSGAPPTMNAAPATTSQLPNGAVTPATHWESAGKSTTTASQSSSTAGQNIVGQNSATSTSPPIRIVPPTTTGNAPGLFQPSGTMSAVPQGTTGFSGGTSNTLNQSLGNQPSSTPAASSSSFTSPSAASAGNSSNSRVVDISQLPPATAPPTNVTSSSWPTATAQSTVVMPATPYNSAPPTLRPAGQ